MKIPEKFFVFCLVLCQPSILHTLNQRQQEQDLAYLSIIKKQFTTLPNCKWNYKYDIGRSIVAVLSFFSAGFVLIFGYKRRRISFGLIGFSTASILTYLIIIGETEFSLIVNIFISLAAGVVVSFFTISSLYCGYFLTGLLGGFLTAFIFLLIYTLFLSLNSLTLPCVIIAVVGLIQTFFTMWWRHRILIFSICMVASAVMAAALDHFVEDLFLLEYIEMKLFYNRVPKLCWWSYLVLSLWPLCFIIGILVQCLYTGKERQKESYIFVFKRKTTIHAREDQNHLIRYGSDY
ncbi:transmembrane protein 198 [Hydra vulgaris]|uniref:Transmembrane protein 198 n=1 Tax=Hydra vulgaris TaxID=6087 RepID=A0ABM4DJK1_HYDVU